MTSVNHDRTVLLPKGWASIAADMYKDGASDTEIKAKLKVTTGLWDSLYNDPLASNFREVVDFGRMLAKAWWLSEGRSNLQNKIFNANLWHMNMKNRYGWSDKTEIRTKPIKELTDEELDMYIRNSEKQHIKASKGS